MSGARRGLGREHEQSKVPPGQGTLIKATLPAMNDVSGGMMADPMDPITVMIVDDHEMVRRGACSYLEAQLDITVVAQAGFG